MCAKFQNNLPSSVGDICTENYGNYTISIYFVRTFTGVYRGFWTVKLTQIGFFRQLFYPFFSLIRSMSIELHCGFTLQLVPKKICCVSWIMNLNASSIAINSASIQYVSTLVLSCAQYFKYLVLVMCTSSAWYSCPFLIFNNWWFETIMSVVLKFISIDHSHGALILEKNLYAPKFKATKCQSSLDKKGRCKLLRVIANS